MIYKLVILSCLISLFQLLHVQAIRAKDDPFCKILGTLSNVICVSKIEFVLSFQDPDVDAPFSCPARTVCSNTQNICESKKGAKPACRNPIIDREGCKNCRRFQFRTEPVCVSQTEFSFCVKGKVDSSVKFPCLSPTSYCKATYNDTTGDLKSICTLDPSTTDCPDSVASANNNQSQLERPMEIVSIDLLNGSTPGGVTSQVN